MSSLMPDGGPTPGTLIAGRTLCIASYVLAILVAAGDLFVPSSTIEEVTRSWTVSVAVAVAFLGVLGIVAVVTHRWRVEWVPATTLFFLLLARACPLWVNLFEVPTRLSAAAMMTLGALCLGKRSLDLRVFDIRTKQAAQAAQKAREL